MDSVALNAVREGLLAFRNPITFTTTQDPVALVKAAIAAEPRIAYYMESCSVSGAGNRYSLQVRYIHKETAPGDIRTVHSKEECLQQMCQAVGNFRKRLVLVAKYSMGLEAVAREFHEKHAAFYSNLVKTSPVGYHISGDYGIFEYTFKYRIGQVKLNMMEQELEDEVERVSRLLFYPGMPDEAKIYLAHNYLAVNVLYRDNDRNDLDVSYTQSAYGAFIRRECVCQGYAEAFKRLMDRAGIPCDVVCGQVVNSDEYHAWNTVYIASEGKHCHIDVTWDARESRPEYVHFCNNDSFYKGKRIWNPLVYNRCSGANSVLRTARAYLQLNKKLLLKRGIEPGVLDCP